MKIFSKSIFLMISIVSHIVSSSAVKVDAILDIPNFQLISPLLSIDCSPFLSRPWRNIHGF
jgi:hypothetical protein